MKPFDSADYLTSPESIGAYIEEVLVSGDSRLAVYALETIARVLEGE